MNQLPIHKRHLEALLIEKIEILVKILRYFIAGDFAKIPSTECSSITLNKKNLSFWTQNFLFGRKFLEN